MFHPINLITTYLVHYMQLSEFSKVSLLQEDFMSQIVMLTVCQKTHKLIHSSVIMVRQKCINNSTMVASLECKTLSLKDESCPIFKVYHYLSSYKGTQKTVLSSLEKGTFWEAKQQHGQEIRITSVRELLYRIYFNTIILTIFASVLLKIK